MYKKTVVLIPSAWSSKALGDVILFADYYKHDFNVVVISDLYEEESMEIDGVNYVKAKTGLADYYIYTAEYLIDAGTANRHSWVYPGQRRVSVWHGVPLKKMFTELHIRHLYSSLNYEYCYDTMISPSEYYTKNFLRESMKYNGNILEIGSSRADNLFIDESTKANIKEVLGLTGKKIVLYAPTYRKPGVIELAFDVDKLLANLDEDTILVTKLHYLNSLDPKFSHKRVLDLTSYQNINELLSITDLLISDYSSLMFDYSILNKNMVLYTYDLEEYTEERGFMFELEDYIDPKFVCTTEKQLYAAVASIDNQDLTAFKNTFYPHETGNSTKKIVEQLDFVPDTRELSEVIFLINDLNQIGGVHTFITNLGRKFKEIYNCKLIAIGIREFSETNDKFHIFDEEGLFDIKLSRNMSSGAVKQILSNTTGVVIGVQFGAHEAFQAHLEDKNTVLMFHGDPKDILNRSLYQWHLDALNNRSLYNYKKLLMLTESQEKVLAPAVIDDVKSRLGFIENSFEFEFNDLYKKSGVFVAVTRLDVDKNIYDYVKVFEHPDLNPDFKLEIYGDGPLRVDLQTEITSKGLDGKIKLMGYEPDKSKIFNDKQGLVTVGLSEGFGLTTTEAYNYGIPVYTYESYTAVHEMVTADFGRIIPTRDFNAYAKALNEGVEFNHEALKAFANTYSNETILSKWEKLIEELPELTAVEKGKVVTSNKYNATNLLNKVKRRYQNMSKPRKVFARNVYNTLYDYKHVAKLKEQPLVSIIMPFYNNGDVIEKAIKSIKAQRYKNIEIILVNDGSEYDEKPLLAKYSNIKYIYKENEGPGEARNVGLDNATGEYIFYLDSDDFLPRGAISALVYYALEHDLYLVGGKSIRIDVENPYERNIWFYDTYKNTYINTRSDRIALLSDNLSTNKLYRRDKLIESGIRFETGLYEDKLYMSKIYRHFDEIGIINHFVYYWNVYGNNTSISTSLSIHNFNERVKRLNEIWEFTNETERVTNYHFAINHDFKIYMNNLCDYDEAEIRHIYESMSESLISKKQYFYPKRIVNILNIEYVNAIFDNDYERFKMLGLMHSQIIKKEKEQDD
ncbi:CDP-glycerol glycerophosphotransferase family protein [Mollicutes bacterium LVI A0039]|nr:CDP-glycerol glycerophosphotransferase family protein [Mollicutes bacterium LVI A0039]